VRLPRTLAGLTAAAAVAAVLAAGCDKGPVQEAGERIDRATDQDRPIGKGPAEKTGKKVDEAVDELKK